MSIRDRASDHFRRETGLVRGEDSRPLLFFLFVVQAGFYETFVRIKRSTKAVGTKNSADAFFSWEKREKELGNFF